MKKLNFWAGIILVSISACLYSCKGGNQGNSQDSSQVTGKTKGGKVQVTLDGIDSATARGMIDTFQKHSSVYTPDMFNFLVKKDTLKKLVKLLEDEYAYGIAHKLKHVTDGVRFYFAIDPKFPQTITMLAVATIDSSLTDFHHDYYTHSDTADLIKLRLKGGLVYAAQSPGASLYYLCDTCKDDTINCNYYKNPHYLKRAVAEAMVKAYGQAQPANEVHTNAEWYDLKMLKAMADDSRCDGIRIYFARHASNEAAFPKRACFVITTTHIYPGNPKVYQDYFDCQTLKSYFIESEARNPKWYDKNKYLNPLYPGQDNGSLCPLNCN